MHSTTTWRVLAAAVVTLAGCSRDPSQDRPAPPPVEVTVARPLVLETLGWDRFTGRLAPVEEVEVRSRVSGHLDSHHFDEGAFVEKGQLLFVIDPRPFRAALDQAVATREEAVARHRQAQASIVAAQAQQQQAAAALDLANAQLRRARPLVPSGAITADELDEYVANQKQAQANALAAEAQITSAQAAVATAAAEIASAEAAVRNAELDLSYCRVAAPLTGRIGRREVTEGNLISGGVGATLLTTIVAINPIHAHFDASEQMLLKHIRLDRKGDRGDRDAPKTPVWMALADEQGYPHRGYIDFVDNRVDRATGSIRVRTIFPNPEGLLVPGVFVTIEVPESAPRERVLLPDSAIATDQASKIVYVVGDDQKVAVRRVSTGPLLKGLRVVDEGLDGGESVVVRGLQRCRPGAEAKTTTETIEPVDTNGLPDSYEPVPPEEWLMALPPSESSAGLPGEGAAPSP